VVFSLHEVYLGDPRRGAQERVETVIRPPIVATGTATCGATTA
jgi:hypothetical protein